MPALKTVSFPTTICFLAVGLARLGRPPPIADEDLVVLPSMAGAHVLRARLLAQELNPLLTFEHAFEAQGDEADMGVEWPRALILQALKRNAET